MISQGLEEFLDYLRETEQLLHIAEQSEQEANAATPGHPPPARALRFAR